MLTSLKEIYDIKESIGISCELGQGDDVLFRICHLKREKDNINILQSHYFESWDRLDEFLSIHKNIPISLHLQGKGVLVKQSPLTDEIDENSVKIIFPNYNEQDYLFCSFSGLSQVWVSLIKTDLYHKITSTFLLSGYQLLQVYLGPFVVDNVLNQLNGYSGHFQFGGHQITRDVDEKEWISYIFSQNLKTKFAVRLQGNQIEEEFVLPYAAGFSLLMHRFLPERNIQDQAIYDLLVEYRQKIKFRANGFLILGTFFLLLLINTSLYTLYHEKYDEVDFQTNEKISNVNEKDKMLNIINRNDSLLLNLGWNGGIKKSWIINQLAYSLENKDGIYLQQVIINPINTRKIGSLKNERENPHKLLITGSCFTLNQLESWIKTLRDYPWLKQIEISKFMDQNKPNSNQKDFVLAIEYTDEL